MAEAIKCPAGSFATDPTATECGLCDERFTIDDMVTENEVEHGIFPCKMIVNGFSAGLLDAPRPCAFDDSCFIQVLFEKDCK